MFKIIKTLFVVTLSSLLLFAGFSPASGKSDPLVFTSEGDAVPQSLYLRALRHANLEAQKSEQEFDRVRARLAAADEDSSTDPHSCTSKVQFRGDGWGEQSPLIITPEGTFQVYNHQYIYTTLIGLYCPNGRRVNKFYPMKASHCYSWQLENRYDDPPQYWYNWTGVNPRFYESEGGRNGNPPTYAIRDDGTMQNCGTQKFSSAKSAWLRTSGDHDPRWRATVKVSLRNPLNDVDFHMRGLHGRPYNKLIPDQMSKLGSWRNP